jgi:orotidine-5'-phosphate decarboxylase
MNAQERSAAREKLIVALDLPSADAAARMAEKLLGHVGMFKIGSELFTAAGPVLIRDLTASGARVFLDLKFHDIPNTVRSAAREATQLGVNMFDVHASGGRRMMEAAREGSHEAGSGIPRTTTTTRPLVIAVTLLTSLATLELEELGLGPSPLDVVVRWAQLAQEAGLDGVVASPREAAAIRRACGPGFVIVTPGIRPASAASNDQARTDTPDSAIRAGADFLVVGRPITTAADPVSAADAIVADITQALAATRVTTP